MWRSTWVVTLVAGSVLAYFATASGQDVPAINVYGPGGPAPAMSDCARTFNARNGANVIVTFGPTSQWRAAASRDADMFYSGAENMMTDFVQAFGEQIDAATIEPVYVRAATIMVRKGNPMKIERFADLLRPGVRIIIVQGSGQTGLWEDIAGRVGDVVTIRALRRNIIAFEPDTATAHNVWNAPNPPDAWISGVVFSWLDGEWGGIMQAASGWALSGPEYLAFIRLLLSGREISSPPKLSSSFVRPRANG
jgi:accessory colonization factor AcfC